MSSFRILFRLISSRFVEQVLMRKVIARHFTTAVKVAVCAADIAAFIM